MEPIEKILRGAVDLFRQYGFKTITMDDISRQAGISKKTLYQHFGNKDEVVIEAMKFFHQFTHAAIVQTMEQSANAIEGMVRMMQYIDQMYRRINPIAMIELQRYYPEAYRLFQENLVHKDIECIRKNIEQGTQEGYYREGLNADLLARYRMETCTMLFQPNSLLNEKHLHYEVNREVAELFLHGIMNARGEKLYNKYKEKYAQVSPV